MSLRSRAAALRSRAGDRRRELSNRWHHGPQAPRVSERLWIDPLSVERAFLWFEARSGQVDVRWPPAPDVAFDEHPHVAFALAHWRDGLPWEETGAYDYMLRQIERRGRQDGCFDLDDVARRFEALDRLYETVGRERRLRTRAELEPGSFREDGGILVHVGPRGELVSGDSGKHRLTIARLHELPTVPVRLGHAHRDALGLLPRLRQGPG
jgi:hypothetical protein